MSLPGSAVVTQLMGQGLIDETASAFAAGCPVAVKGHPAHPGTGELVARASRAAVCACGLPEGVFSHIPGSRNALGAALVSDPHITAVGFTGSRAGDLHVHFFGTATLSFSDGAEPRPGDIFEVLADAFVLPLVNPLACGEADRLVEVVPL